MNQYGITLFVVDFKRATLSNQSRIPSQNELNSYCYQWSSQDHLCVLIFDRGTLKNTCMPAPSASFDPFAAGISNKTG